VELILISIGVLGFLGSLPQFFGSNWIDIYRYGFKGKISWDLVHKSSQRLLVKMREEGFNPTVVVGIGRGGVIAAGLIASEITRRKIVFDQYTINKIPELPQLRLATINTNVVFKSIVSTKDGGKQSIMVDRIILNEGNCSLNQDDKVLLLVAQNFTGTTLEKAITFVVAKGVLRENVKSATLFWQKLKGVEPSHLLDTHQPDFYGMVIASSKTMPWKIKDSSTDRNSLETYN